MATEKNTQGRYTVKSGRGSKHYSAGCSGDWAELWRGGKLQPGGVFLGRDAAGRAQQAADTANRIQALGIARPLPPRPCGCAYGWPHASNCIHSDFSRGRGGYIGLGALLLLLGLGLLALAFTLWPAVSAWVVTLGLLLGLYRLGLVGGEN